MIKQDLILYTPWNIQSPVVFYNVAAILSDFFRFILLIYPFSCRYKIDQWQPPIPTKLQRCKPRVIILNSCAHPVTRQTLVSDDLTLDYNNVNPRTNFTYQSRPLIGSFRFEINRHPNKIICASIELIDASRVKSFIQRVIYYNSK